jgi:hypothetical protein
VRRAAIVWLGAGLLRQLLRLPEGQHVVSVHADWLRLGVAITIEGDDLAEVADLHEPPSIDPAGYVDLELRPKFEALAQRYHAGRDDPAAREAMRMVRQVLSGELDPRIDMPEDLVP